MSFEIAAVGVPLSSRLFLFSDCRNTSVPATCDGDCSGVVEHHPFSSSVFQSTDYVVVNLEGWPRRSPRTVLPSGCASSLSIRLYLSNTFSALLLWLWTRLGRYRGGRFQDPTTAAITLWMSSSMNKKSDVESDGWLLKSRCEGLFAIAEMWHILKFVQIHWL